MAKKIAAIVVIVVGLLALYNNISWFMRYLYPLKYQEYIVKYARQYKADPYMVAAIIKVESNFLPEAVSRKGAIGLMQLMPDTARWAAEKMGMKDIDDEKLMIPETNIKIGTWYLSNLLEEFNGDITLALAAYNGGRGNVSEWLKSKKFRQEKQDMIPFAETKSFVMKVKRAHKWYRRLYKL